jgi:hypothetical protein
MRRPGHKLATASARDRRPANAQQLLGEQSFGKAAIASLGIAVLFNFIWLWLANLTGNFFHWFSLLQGPAIGYAIQRAGRGIDWRFPLLAILVTVIAAYGGNFLVSLATTADILEVSLLQVLRGLTLWSWQTWYAEVLISADLIYALFAAAVAAFFSQRRLRREEVFALRTMQQEMRR